jgi:hypothetical protein
MSDCEWYVSIEPIVEILNSQLTDAEKLAKIRAYVTHEETIPL